MTHDRDYYRCLPTELLLDTARREGINPELAIVAFERLAEGLSEGLSEGSQGNFQLKELSW